MPPFLRRFVNLFVPSRHNAHRPRLLHKQWLVALLGLTLVCEGVIVGNALLSEGPNVFLAAVVRSDIVSYTDEARTKEGGQSLIESELLTEAAQAKAEDMATRGYFSHVGPDGEEPWVWIERAGYNYQYAGENLAVRFEDSKDIVDAWMDSPGHRANIVKPQYREIGIGIAEGEYKGGSATFVVQYFAAPASAATPVVSDAPSANTKLAEVPNERAVAGAQTPPDDAPVVNERRSQSPVRSFINALFSGSDVVAVWTLSSIALILASVIALTFFIRIQVQPTDLLVPGAAVALIAITFLSVNTHYLGGSQTASVALSHGEMADALSVERPPAFPEVPERNPHETLAPLEVGE